MKHKNKIQLTYVITAPPEEVKEGDRIFLSHIEWMKKTHTKEGKKALLSYNVSKSAELENPMDSNSDPTGNICFILSEIYETESGVAEHFKMAMDSWDEFQNLVDWLGRCKVSGVPAAPIFNSLW